MKHPVITSFLWFKWERIRPYFNRNLRLYLLFVFLLTWFIFANFGGHSQRETIEATFANLYIVVVLLMVVSIARDWWKDVKVSSTLSLTNQSGKYSSVELCSRSQSGLTICPPTQSRENWIHLRRS